MTLPLNAKQLTIESYNTHAAVLAERYNKLDRRNAIEWIFTSLPKSQPFIFEIGCGSGRDAKELLTRTNRYIGLDISGALIAFAKQTAPNATFIEGDIETFELPTGIDLVYSSASLLHVDKTHLSAIAKRLHEALAAGGMVYLSLKATDKYHEELQTDAYGSRAFYHYSLDDIRHIFSNFRLVKHRFLVHERGVTWVEALLQKI